LQGVVIKVAEKAGFCFGVRRAVRMAYEAAERESGPVFTLGPLIHNPQVVERLREKGVEVASNHMEIPEGATVIIRSHGVPLEVMEHLNERGIRVIDATCPFVKKAQDIVAHLSGRGYGVVIVGDAQHPEVKALLSYGRDRAVIYPRLPSEGRVGVVSQTTQLLDRFLECVSVIMRSMSFSELRVFNTVCQSTAERQSECRRLAKEADVMVVVGGRNSANTRKLVEIARSQGVSAHHIEVAKELNPSWFLGKRVIGIAAGASTPDWIIEEVVEEVKRMTGGIVDGRG